MLLLKQFWYVDVISEITYHPKLQLPNSDIGKMERNLPFLFFVVPPWFEKQFPELVANIRFNAERLVTAFDIHKTLQHLLHLQTSSELWNDTLVL